MATNETTTGREKPTDGETVNKETVEELRDGKRRVRVTKRTVIETPAGLTWMQTGDTVVYDDGRAYGVQDIGDDISDTEGLHVRLRAANGETYKLHLHLVHRGLDKGHIKWIEGLRTHEHVEAEGVDY